jgi:hypothetical protein
MTINWTEYVVVLEDSVTANTQLLSMNVLRTVYEQ